MLAYEIEAPSYPRRSLIRMRRSRLVLAALLPLCVALSQTYTISTIAGGYPPVNIPGTSASLDWDMPLTIAADRAGNVFFVDQGAVLRLDAVTGLLTAVAGNGTTGFSGDHDPATSAQLALLAESPVGLAVDSAGNLYISDAINNRIRKVSNGIITTVAGTGIGGFSGDNGPAVNAEIDAPEGLAVDSAGNLYCACNGASVRS
jgi:trimeric autotransporter adhesin